MEVHTITATTVLVVRSEFTGNKDRVCTFSPKELLGDGAGFIRVTCYGESIFLDNNPEKPVPSNAQGFLLCEFSERSFRILKKEFRDDNQGGFNNQGIENASVGYNELFLFNKTSMTWPQSFVFVVEAFKI